jgi:hypothetical protein
MFIVVEKSVVFVASDQSAEEKSGNTITAYSQPIDTPEAPSKPVAEHQQGIAGPSRWSDYPASHGFDKILEEWRREYEDICSEGLTHQL